MHQILFYLPVAVLLAAAGFFLGLLTISSFLKEHRRWVPWTGALAGMALALALGAQRGWLAAGWPVRGYGVMILLGFLLGVWLAQRRSRQIGVEPEHCLDVGLWGVLGGVVGARAFHVLQHWETYSPLGENGFAALLGIFKVWEGGLVFFGAFAMALLVTVIYCRAHKIPLLPFLDLAAPSLIAGQALGRIGCFLNGCCFGRPCAYPWSVEFPPGSPGYAVQWTWAPGDAGSSAGPYRLSGLHPTQLYAFWGAALTAGFLYSYGPRRRFDGQIFGLMLLLAGVTRFWEEVLRADTPALFPGFAPSLSVAQWMGLGLAACGALGLLCFSRRSRTPAPQAP